MNPLNLEKTIDKLKEDLISKGKDNYLELIIQSFFEHLLKSERELFLESTPEKNKGNGYYKRMVRGINQYFEIEVPRDRLGIFKPFVLELLKTNDDRIKTLAFELYTKGLSTSEISDVLNKIYGKRYSPSSISNITSKFKKHREAWQKRKLDKEYYAVYVDAIHINVRRDTVEKEAFYILVGIKKDFTREVLGIYNIPTESASGWALVLSDIKSRGVENVLLFVCDNLTGLAETIKKYFRTSEVQLCIVHKKRRVLTRVRSKDKKEIAEDLKHVFKLEKENFCIEKGKIEVEKFKEKWKKRYPFINRMFREEDLNYYFAYTRFPLKMQRMIYTTNCIERLNKSIRRTEKPRNSFPNIDSALNLLVAYVIELHDRKYRYKITSIMSCKDELDEMFSQ